MTFRWEEPRFGPPSLLRGWEGSSGTARIGWKRMGACPRDTWRHARLGSAGDLRLEAQPCPGQGLRKGGGKERRPHAYGCRGDSGGGL